MRQVSGAFYSCDRSCRSKCCTNEAGELGKMTDRAKNGRRSHLGPAWSRVQGCQGSRFKVQDRLTGNERLGRGRERSRRILD